MALTAMMALKTHSPFSLGDKGASTSTSLTSDFDTSFKRQTESNIAGLYNQIVELKNAFRVEKQKTESFIAGMAQFREQARQLETRLSHLQRMVAKQSDGTKDLKKELEDANSAAKSELDKIVEEIRKLNVSRENTDRKVSEVQRSGGASGNITGNLQLPENMKMMFQALERQLGMYDAEIARADQRFLSLQTTNYDGSLVWKVTEYARRKGDARAGKSLSIYSQPFYTSRFGYKTCARIYLNGDGAGKGTHISLFFVVMKGENDAILPWPFRQKVTFMLLDQGPDRRHLSEHFRPDPTSSSFKRPTSDMNIASGCPLFVLHTTVEDSSYIKEDTLFLRIVVDTTDLVNL